MKTFNRELWKKVVSEGLPGERAQREMAPDFRGEFSHPGDPVVAAVLVLLYPDNEQVSTVFIKRNEYPGHHSAQVSFPGGAWEMGDPSLEHTALRETREELGISDRVEVLGQLTNLYIPVSNFMVTPFVGIIDRRPDFNPDGTEVQFLIEVSLEALSDPARRGSELLVLHGLQMITPFYRVGDEKIWGATAMILSEFLQVVSRMR
jgi:8-oxo-dGTP pyrophosphatase MutT (NUDIX family)